MSAFEAHVALREINALMNDLAGAASGGDASSTLLLAYRAASLTPLIIYIEQAIAEQEPMAA